MQTRTTEGKQGPTVARGSVGTPPQSALTPLGRAATYLAIAAAAVVIVSQLLGFARGVPDKGDKAEFILEPLSTVYASLQVVGFLLLLLALVGLYERQRDASGQLGMIGFLVAFVGTALAMGDWWFELFAAPYFADLAPRAVEKSASGQLATGGMITFVLFALGWVLFGLASLRAGVFPRLAAGLMIVGGVLGFLAGLAPLQIPLALAVGWFGYSLYRAAPREASVVPPVVAGGQPSGSV